MFPSNTSSIKSYLFVMKSEIGKLPILSVFGEILLFNWWIYFATMVDVLREAAQTSRCHIAGGITVFCFHVDERK